MWVGSATVRLVAVVPHSRRSVSPRTFAATFAMTGRSAGSPSARRHSRIAPAATANTAAFTVPEIVCAIDLTSSRGTETQENDRPGVSGPRQGSFG